MLNEMSPYILLGFLIAGVMHAFIPQQTFARHLSGTGWKAVVKSALIGVPLPLCSCGVLPTAIAMRRNGASRAASTSFLVATPQTGVDSIAATWSLLGPAFAVIRPVAALTTAVAGGIAVGKGEENDNRDNVNCDCSDQPSHTSCHDEHCGCSDVQASGDNGNKSFLEKTVGALRYGFVDLVGSIGSWLIAGLLIAALITVYVPADFFAFMGTYPIVSMIAVLIVAIPMYVCATGSIPIAMSLMMKGLSPGTALVLLMAGPAANFASFTLISREMGRKAAVTYLLSIIAGAITFGLAIDYLMPSGWFPVTSAKAACHHGVESISWFETACTCILIVLLAVAMLRRYIPDLFKKQNDEAAGNVDDEVYLYVVEGMNCTHCRDAVATAIAGVNGVSNVEVDLSSGIAKVYGSHNVDALTDAVTRAGFDITSQTR